jgi:hypothetical protein
MSNAVRFLLLVVCGVLGAPLVASAQGAADLRIESFIVPATPPPGMPFGGGGMAYPGSLALQRGSRGMRSRRVSRQQPQWIVPSGEYGLELADGTRMIGRPAKDWSARITSAFGTVTIPLTQIAHLAPAGNGQFAAYLKNGDRVTGSLVSNTMRFETKFGTLSVAATDIARLRSSNAAIAQPVAAMNSRSSNPRTRRRAGRSGGIRIGRPSPFLPRPSSGGFPRP